MNFKSNNYIFNMSKSISLFIFLIFTSISFSQIGGGFGKFGGGLGGGAGGDQGDSSYTQIPKGDYKDYLIINMSKDTTYIDTTLTIQKYYKLNELKKDNFGLSQFANIGEPYSRLSYDFDNSSLYHEIGAVARDLDYIKL